MVFKKDKSDDKAHAKAFDKGTDADKLAATSEQYREQTGQDDLSEGGPDPIVEAADKAVADLNIEPVDVERTTYVSQETTIEEPDKAEPGQFGDAEGAVSEGNESALQSEDTPTAGTTTQEAESREASKDKNS